MKMQNAINAINATLLGVACLTISPQAAGQDVLTGDKKLACEAVLCLAASTQPSECTAAIQRYFSISLRKWSQTANARRNFLSLCPNQNPRTISELVSNTRLPSDEDEPAPPPVGASETIAMTLPQLLAEYSAAVAQRNAAREAALPYYQTFMSCLAGRKYDGSFCTSEYAAWTPYFNHMNVLDLRVQELARQISNRGGVVP